MLLSEKQFVKLAKEGRLKIKTDMQPLHSFCGFIAWKESDDKKKKVICTVEPKLDIFKNNYFKLYLIAEDKAYGKDEWYLDDLLSFINEGRVECIIK